MWVDIGVRETHQDGPVGALLRAGSHMGVGVEKKHA
jgi:hypothetical protein